MSAASVAQETGLEARPVTSLTPPPHTHIHALTHLVDTAAQQRGPATTDATDAAGRKGKGGEGGARGVSSMPRGHLFSLSQTRALSVLLGSTSAASSRSSKEVDRLRRWGVEARPEGHAEGANAARTAARSRGGTRKTMAPSLSLARSLSPPTNSPRPSAALAARARRAAADRRMAVGGWWVVCKESARVGTRTRTRGRKRECEQRRRRARALSLPSQAHTRFSSPIRLPLPLSSRCRPP